MSTETHAVSAPRDGQSKAEWVAAQLEDAGWTEYLISILAVGTKMSPHSHVPEESVGKTPGDIGPYGGRGLPGWQKMLTSKAMVAGWVKNGLSLGVRTGAGITIVDIDSDYIAVTRRLVAEHEAAFGATLQRWRGPRVALLYRTAGAASPKRIIEYTDSTSAVVFKEEHLGEGQQAVMGPGKHKSGQFYLDQHGEHFIYAMMRTPVASLPSVSGDDLKTRGLAIAQRVAREYGLTATMRSERGARERERIDQADLLCPWPIDQLASLVASIPNELSSSGDRSAYLKTGYAVKAASGAANDSAGLEMFQEWAGRWEGPYDPDVTAADWHRMKAPFAIGFAWLCARAGVAVSADEFTASEAES